MMVNYKLSENYCFVTHPSWQLSLIFLSGAILSLENYTVHSRNGSLKSCESIKDVYC